MTFSPSSNSSRFKDGYWWWLALALTLVKLWLTRAQMILAITPAAHDDRLFIDLAASILRGEWLGPYTEFTLAKGPFYSIWIAGVHAIGLPLGLAQQMAYAGACALLVLSLGRLLTSPAAKLAAYSVLLWNPLSFDGPSLSRVLRQNIYNPLGLVIFAGLIALYVRRERTFRQNLPWTIGTGLALGCFWITREESIWIIPSLVLLSGTLFTGLPWSFAAWRRPAVLLLVIGAMAYVPILTVSSLNYHYYGWYGTVEMRAKEFKDAYGALQRIKIGPELSDIPITRQAREASYAISPMFAQLRPQFEGKLGERWAFKENGYTLHDREIAGGWFVWALREAVHTAGFAPDAASALTFYRYMADEINAACDDGRIEAGPRRSGFFPKWHPDYTAKLKPAFLEYADYFATFSSGTARNDPSTGDEEGRDLFSDITRDRISPLEGEKTALSPLQSARDTWKIFQLNFLGGATRKAIIVMLAFAHLLWLVLLGQALRHRRFSYPLLLATAAWGGAAAYFTINLLVHVTSFPNMAPSAMASGYPLLILFGIATTMEAATAWGKKAEGRSKLASLEPWLWSFIVIVLIIMSRHTPGSSLAGLGLHALLGGAITYTLRSQLSFMSSFAGVSLLLASLALAPGHMDGAQTYFGLLGGLSLLFTGVFAKPRTPVWIVGLALGVLGLITSPESWVFAFGLGLLLLWVSSPISILRLLPLVVGSIGLIFFIMKVPQAKPVAAFTPAFLQTLEASLRWPSTWSASGVIFHLPLVALCLLLRRRKEAPVPFDVGVCALGLAALLHAVANAWLQAGEVSFLQSPVWSALGIIASGLALIRLVQRATLSWQPLAWALGLVWTAFIFHGFRDLAGLTAPIVDQPRWLAAFALAAFAGGLLVSRSALRTAQIFTPPEQPDRLRLVFLALPGVLALLVLAGFKQSFEDVQEARWSAIFSPRSAEVDLKFGFATESSLPDTRLLGAANISPVFIRNILRGTRPDGDGFTGTIKSETFKTDSPWLVVPIAGYPVSEGNDLRLAIEDSQGKAVATVPYTGNNPGEHVSFWQVDVRSWPDHAARLILTDGRALNQAWLAAGPPIRTADSSKAASLQRQLNWSFYTGAIPALRWIVFVSALAFLCVAGFTVLRWAQRRRNLSL